MITTAVRHNNAAGPEMTGKTAAGVGKSPAAWDASAQVWQLVLHPREERIDHRCRRRADAGRQRRAHQVGMRVVTAENVANLVF